MNVGAYGHFDDTTGEVWRHVKFFVCCSFNFDELYIVLL